MDYGIAGRTALVVGGSKGIGFSAARMLAVEGSGSRSSPDEIASTIVYFCSHGAGYLTGHYIAVDGGHHRSAF